METNAHSSITASPVYPIAFFLLMMGGLIIFGAMPGYVACNQAEIRQAYSHTIR